MSDKSYIPPSGEVFQVRKAPGGGLQVGGPKGAAAPVHVQAERARIDHQTQRVLWDKSSSRRLLWVYATRGKRILSWPGGSIELEAADLCEGVGPGSARLKPLKLTMPGKVVSVKVKTGDVVEASQGLLIVEAMKMENLLLAPARARVAKVHVSEGERLDSGALLVTFESAD